MAGKRGEGPEDVEFLLMSDLDLPALAESILTEAFARFPIKVRPQIVWKNTRVTAGVAYDKSNVIGLSRIVLDDEEKLRRTLLHEYAHLLAVARHGVRAAGHGETWKQAMRDLGLEPEVRHKYPVQRNASRQRVTYRCLKCGKTFERSRKLPARRRYVHAHCGGGLRLVEVKRITVGDFAA